MAKYNWKVDRTIQAEYLESALKKAEEDGWVVYQIFPLKHQSECAGKIHEECTYNVIYKRKKS